MRLTLIIFLFFLNNYFLHSQNTTHFAPDSTEQSLFWRIEGKDLKEVSYLYGTIHLIPKKDLVISPAMERAISTCKKMTFEVNLKKMSGVMAQFSMLRKAVMKKDTTLEMLLSDRDYNLVVQKFGQLGLPPKLIRRVKPLFLSSLLEGDPRDKEMGSYEMSLFEIAKTQKLKIDGLESVEHQMNVLDSIPYGVQAEGLMESIRNPEASAELYQLLLDCYKNQDLICLEKQFENENEADIQPYQGALLDNRNQQWIPVMEKMLQQQATFFAVGAGHLVGENGVIAMLRKKGYILTSIKKND